MQAPDLLASSSTDWRSELRNVVTSGEELLGLLGLNAAEVGFSGDAVTDFPLKVPHSFVGRMKYADAKDPLLLQVMATGSETLAHPDYVSDPVGECGTSNPQPGIIHKYHGRVLLIVSGGCAINCRYCFRRLFPYSDNQNSRQEWSDALEYIRTDSTIEEVILSGGDPLIASDQQLRELVQQIGSIAHVKRLRVHSRLPVVIPARVTDALLDALSHSLLQTIMVIHCNHAQEIDAAVKTAVAALRDRNIPTFNQAVLLAGVNDSVEAQVALNERLFAAGAQPYYLHLLDKVSGAAHFDVAEADAVKLMAEVSARMPGYMVPKLVREIAGENAKTGVR